MSVTINAPPPIPAQPAATSTQLTCTASTGAITVNTPAPATGTSYSIDGTDYSNTTGIFNALAPNNYNLTVRNSFGCVSPSLTVTINSPPPVPPQPTATPTQPTCALATGTITVNTPIPALGISYSIDGKDYSNTMGSFPGLAPNTYNVTVKNSAGCISPVRTITINSPPPMPVATATGADIPVDRAQERSQ